MPNRPAAFDPGADSDARPTPHADVPELRDFSSDRRLLLLAAMAVIVGSGGALAAWALSRLINLVTQLAYFGRWSAAPADLGAHALGAWAVLIPVAGCLIIGLMARYASEKIRGHGIPEAMEAILIGRSRIQARVAILKPLASAISIGTGGPFGAEGPIIMTGGALGSLFAQMFHLTNAERKTLLVAGAAAGMSATFGTPVAAILLAVELLLFEWKPRSFVPVTVAAIVAAAWRFWALGSAPLFPLAAATALPGGALLLCVVLGTLAGLASGLLTALVYGCEDLFERLPVHWMWWPLLGGLVVGVGGLIEPRALGVGYLHIGALLQGQLGGGPALRLMLVKAVIWSVALGSGTSGGVLAPLLMMGGVLGALFGGVVAPADTGTWALVGMAAMMGGTMRAPLTAMMFGLELTHDIGAMMPLVIGCAAAHTTTVLLLKRSILTEKIARRGHHIVREYVVDPFETMRVADIMAQPAEALPASWTVRDVVTFFTDPAAPRRHKSYPVTDRAGCVVGMVSRADTLRWMLGEVAPTRTLAEQCAGQELMTGYGDELVGHLADRMNATGTGRVPILERPSGRLLGLVARRDLLRVRAHVARHEREREALIRVLPRREVAGER
ncbi:MAG TPA: chloride channel protein [Steroidobacteraceae bacterium]|nr:chloride channel protein [Steroidobacteraceae bacterium]